MTLAGLTLITDWGEEVAKINQGSNEAIRAAAIRNGIPTEVIDDIILKTGNFAHTAKWVGRGFIASGAIVSVIDATVAISEGDYNEAAMAGLDLLAGLGTAAVGGPMGILYYGGYMLIMHQPAVPRPAYISDPLSPWNTLPRIDNTYVAPNYQY